ncbi:MAG: TPM domain-containing protein [Pontiella sp.]|nr:TPM domain-containing protein [Pontiella sp.]
MLIKKVALVGLLLSLCLPSAQASDRLLEQLAGRGKLGVNDFANVIPANQEQQINEMIVELKQKAGAEIAVVTLQSLEGGEIEDFSNRLFERWGIGQRGKDNGLLFVAAMQDRKMRIEVGYGLEGAIPDSTAGRIRRDIITPQFKIGKPGTGILLGIAALSQEVAQEYGVELTGAASRYRSTGRSAQGKKGNPFVQLILAILFIIFAIRHPFIAMMLLSGGRGYSSGGGGFGGGGFSGGGFGGGMSGGGGSSGGW